ncbi:cornifelin-like [Chanos chanos]|uniref:Cornifelin-like n=1 Tax=Chanos chanos TaxID=29144 RepID=A0A6J2WXG5_CHACN|nr:cornifelin-like [Chanos chanos]
MTTTVVVQQQPQKSNTHQNVWSTGLFDCCDDIPACCYAYWCCPCFAVTTTGQFGENPWVPLIDVLGPIVMAFCGVVVCMPPVTLSMRVAMRYKYEIVGSICEDIFTSWCCATCSWCQMNREIRERKKYVTVVTTQQVMVGQQVMTAAQCVDTTTTPPQVITTQPAEVTTTPSTVDPPADATPTAQDS